MNTWRPASFAHACPLGHRCESCGAATSGLGIYLRALTTDTGELCMTLCLACSRSTTPPPIRPDTAARFAEQHAHHRNGARP